MGAEGNSPAQREIGLSGVTEWDARVIAARVRLGN
jgi:hypothetical protein